MNTDCAFYIGTTHEICQDYALAGKNSIAISDGCSGSVFSDIGSRLLCITAMNKMTELNSLYEFDEKECILLARPSVKMLNIPNESLDATLLTSILYENKEKTISTLEAMCYGDGVIIIKIKNEDTIIINCSYTDNYPFYINYLYDQTGRYLDWKENHNKKQITQTVLGVNKKNIFSKPIDASTRLFGNLGLVKTTDTNMTVEVLETNKLIEFIAIMSDGVHSFYETAVTDTSKNNISLSYLDVIKELLDFKNFKGKFVQRRMNKFRKDCVKKNWANSDDLSLAVIYIGE